MWRWIRAFGNLSGRGLGSGDDEELGIGQQLCHGDRDITRARRQIEQQHVEVAPEHVGEELLQGAMEHRTSPDDGLARRDEHADAHHLHVMGDLRQDHLVDSGRLSGETEHAGNGEAVDIGVDDADAQPFGRQ